MNTQQKEIRIKKASGESEPFAESKLRNSLKRAGASQKAIDAIVQDVTSSLRDGMTTKDIYLRAFSLLRQKERPTAGRYHLRMALMELGPSGHPFEKFVGALLKAEGFSTKVSVIMQGRCVSHELDVVAEKGEEHIMVECKFHNQYGIKSDVKIALYVQARFEDIEKRWKAEPGHGTKLHAVWLVTNTKFTTDATDYASCVGMHALGWGYPATESLQELVERYSLHPVTCLTTLDHLQKQELIQEGYVLCKDILNNQADLEKIVRNPTHVSEIVQEARELLKTI